jgi:hypothetical protein
MVVVKKLVILFISLFFFSNCRQDVFKELILLDFESDAELDQLYWSCHTLYSLSNDHVTHGSKSLKLELFPSDYPGLVFTPVVKDWSDYKELYFDVYNPSRQEVQVIVRIDDKKEYPEYNDRFNKGFVMRTGNNHVSIPLDTLVASGSNRHLNNAHIKRLFIFVTHPPRKITLYIDTIKLVR